MKKNLYLIFWAMSAVFMAATACSNSSSDDDPYADGALLSFSIQCGDSYYRRAIDQTTRVIDLSGIRYAQDITGVSYRLAEGATIAPDPKEVTLWKRTQQFTVRTAGGETFVYTVNLTDLVESSSSGKAVIGYLPAGDGNFDTQLEQLRWDCLTHVNISFAHAKADGTLNTADVPDDKIARVLEVAHSYGVKVLISVNKNSSGEFRTAIGSASTRSALAQNIVTFTREHGLDGFDIDYEDYDNWDSASLVAFAEALYGARDEQMAMTCAVVCWKEYTAQWQQYFDYINIMSYDYVMASSSSTPGQHATYDKFVSDLEYWRGTEQAPREKIVGGLPFYGYSWDDDMSKDNVGAVRYSQIISFFGAKGYDAEEIADADQISKTYYNGRTTIRKKCQYVVENSYGGVMIWQMFQDTQEEALKLIDVVDEEMNR